jgi:hypothetical protein
MVEVGWVEVGWWFTLYTTISIKSVNISIPKSDRKVLIDNIYKPPVNYNGHIIKSMNTGVP